MVREYIFSKICLPRSDVLEDQFFSDTTTRLFRIVTDDADWLIAPVLRVIEAHKNKCLVPEYRGWKRLRNVVINLSIKERRIREDLKLCVNILQ